MKVLRTRRLAGRAGCAALILGVAGTAGAVPAQARGAATVSQSQVVASWGDNGTGQLGDGTTISRSRYGDIGALDNVIRVAVGYGQLLTVRSDGTAWAWGSNFHGELGDGTTDARFAPVQVTGLTGVTQVAGGCDHSLALRSDGTVWAWGGNTVGQLGNGSTASSAVPVKITGVSQVTAIAAGWDSAVAIVAGGASVWTWGGNDNGQLGDGTLTGHATPVRVTQIGTVHIAGAAVGYKSAAILGTDGSVWAWGNDTRGQLGNAPAATPVTRPVNTIRADSGITQVAAGGGDMVALKSDGTVLAWGDNTDGELGIGTTTPVTGPVQVTGLTGDTQARAGQVLQAAGLVLGAVTTVTDKYCNHLGVMSQDPPAGTTVRSGSAVSVTIGQAPATGCP
jgi:alpha-tubulin suppressor-like RCC1 family protein